MLHFSAAGDREAGEIPDDASLIADVQNSRYAPGTWGGCREQCFQKTPE